MAQIQAKKYLGQNFLRNKKILEMIVGSESLENISVIEVGPGPGDLTAEILQKKPKSLTLVELDTDMIPLLLKRFDGNSIIIYENDVLQMNIVSGQTPPQTEEVTVIKNNTTLQSPPYQVYGNIPYYITSPILHHFLYDVELRPNVAIFTMQKEVADRILARENHAVLSLACQLVADVAKICDISPHNFIPVPKVWSTCLKFTIKPGEHMEARQILGLIKKGFSQKRKKLLTNLSQNGYEKTLVEEEFRKMQLSENIRAEELSLEQWIELFHALKKA